MTTLTRAIMDHKTNEWKKIQSNAALMAERAAEVAARAACAAEDSSDEIIVDWTRSTCVLTEPEVFVLLHKLEPKLLREDGAARHLRGKPHFCYGPCCRWMDAVYVFVNLLEPA